MLRSIRRYAPFAYSAPSAPRLRPEHGVRHASTVPPQGRGTPPAEGSRKHGRAGRSVPSQLRPALPRASPGPSFAVP